MTTYYITSTDCNAWVKCTATTLRGAKRQATAEYGDGFVDATLSVAAGDNVTEQRQVLSSRSNYPTSDWQDNSG